MLLPRGHLQSPGCSAWLPVSRCPCPRRDTEPGPGLQHTGRLCCAQASLALTCDPRYRKDAANASSPGAACLDLVGRGSFPWARFPVLTSVSPPAPPERRFLGPGLLDMDLQARFSRHTLPEVSPRLDASLVLPGALPISPVPAEGLPYQHSTVWKL
ncbi:uncharacterized protein LOC121364636 isoform X2 [Pyrgilauda ruficollis]|uniref:uncharacterized protein LOC121364636 isoform X2 n=1 Tax=Pyrgilauda ruficollis TaxID=221976 RepID=UPI001B878A74|nr:uncharacterized protein LOC121364636 isoform X2 [Pyrgilauda ruficollis]